MAPTHRFTLAELAERFQLELRGDGTHELTGVGTLSAAAEHDLSFLANSSYRNQLAGTRAGVVILRAEDAAACPVSCLVAADPYLAFARAAQLFDHRPAPEPGIHQRAAVDASAHLGANVSVGAHAVIGANSRIGEGSVIGPGCVIAAESVIGAACRLGPNVTVMDGVKLGDRVIVHPGAVIGADGFGIAFSDDHWEKVPQLGGVSIGDDCEIGANSTIDRGAIEDTVLEADVRIDNLVQVAHNVYIGAHSAIAGCSGIAGSARIGRYVLVGGHCGIAGHIEIADRVTVAAQSAVMKSITEAGATWSSLLSARPIRNWQRSVAQLNRLDGLVKKVRSLERNQRKSEES
jgi:UDP-3-O-[3-hydroxymyristoyl] glucosamine N-acyltransferase